MNRSTFGGLRGALAAAALAVLMAVAPAAAANARPAADQPAARTARPALWRLADEDTVIYLFGTIHALPEGLDWRSPPLDRAMAEADELVLEVGDSDDPSALARALRADALAEGLPPILDRVPAERRDALREAIARTGIPLQAFDRMKSWSAGLVLIMASLQRIGIEQQRGVEQGLSASWRARGRPVLGLETPAQQFGFLQALSEDSQRLFLVAAADDDEAARRQFEQMLAAWAAGDVAAIARTFNEDALLSEELRDVLLTRRNRTWADWLKARMERPGTAFVAVGAGHLAGEVSVQAMLAERGLATERVQ